MMDIIIGAIFLYSAQIHWKHFKRPAECGRPEIKRMAITIMLVSGGYGVYLIYNALGG